MTEFIISATPKTTAILRVAKRGKALYLYLPSDLVEIYGLLPGYKVEVRLDKIYRPKTLEEGSEE